MRRRWWLGGAAVMVLASGLYAKQGIVHLKDGNPAINGDVDDSKPDQVVITVHGVRTTIPRDNVASIEYPGSVDDQFTDRMSKLDPHDAAGRVEVARWAYEAGRYDLARKATAEALAIEPGNGPAQDLMASINHQGALANHGATPGAPAHADNGNPAAAQTEKQYLTPADINQIRQLEMKADESRLRVSFDHDVRKRFVTASGTSAHDFFAKTPGDQARDILTNGDPSMAPDVKIESDPAALMEFHQHIQPIILSGCATSGCHNASTAAGGFGLYTGDESPAAWYTDFYLLQTYSARGAGGTSRSMIDRTYPDKSLLAQYGLPLNVADTPHPKVENFKQIFTSVNDPHYRELIRWMSEALKPDAGGYPDIRYEPSWAGPTSRPASAPPKAK